MPRELEVLQAADTGERNKEDTLGLDISVRTVKAHLTSVYNKLGVDSRAGAIAIAEKKNNYCLPLCGTVWKIDRSEGVAVSSTQRKCASACR